MIPPPIDLYAEDVSPLRKEPRPACPWCQVGLDRGCVTLANGQTVCDDCGALAAEVGDGALTIARLASRSGSVALRAPLHLRLGVSYTEDGSRWLSAFPADEDARRVMEDLGLYDDAGRLALTGVTRADIGADDLDYLLEPLFGPHALADSFEEDEITALRRHLVLPEAALAADDSTEG